MAPNSRPERIPDKDDVDHSEIWLTLDYSSGLKTVTICKKWREHALSLNYCWVSEELYGFPDEGAKVTNCPGVRIFIYAHHLVFGMRFPLDLVLVKILKAFNICLAQLTPLAVRNLVA